MKRVIALALLTACVGNVHAEEDVMAANMTASKEAIQEFFGDLKGNLESAMKEGGPLNALDVCHKVAPAIAKNQSEKHGLQIGRTSLKVRNPDNTPDEWERTVLEEFERRNADGERVANLSKTVVVEENGQKTFRFMKAIPVGEVCLKCHGENIDPAVAAKISELYPQDQARGYKLGELRGAFTIKKAM